MDRAPGAELLERPRCRASTTTGSSSTTRVRVGNALRNLGPLEAARCALSYFKARLVPDHESAVVRGLGVESVRRRLYRIFFKTYTEKVWGMSVQRDLGRLGGAAHQGTVARDGDAARDLAARARRRTPLVVKTLIDIVPLSAARAGHDVGSAAGTASWRRRKVRALGAASCDCRFDGTTARWEVTARTTTAARRRFAANARRSVGADARAHRARSSRRFRRACSDAADALALPRLHDGRADHERSREPAATTGSTSTTRRCASGASRIFKSWSPDLVPDPAM